ncbi:hypothetical protein K443DRAFT_10428 [Laccaria amethystina LaAM-08-1]|uniref:Uncharacterized protein n=1 Tax=Laccaria amethystina LaAM-08-1 TaxID=1095629 RepID=A0A0C9XKM3_9AGAR|nr:hypothetical protein K443DRAFT_10428 [Laccaria amethystina LaAM-08-1]
MAPRKRAQTNKDTAQPRAGSQTTQQQQLSEGMTLGDVPDPGATHTRWSVESRHSSWRTTIWLCL